jgi:prefoldin alpha subunit
MSLGGGGGGGAMEEIQQQIEALEQEKQAIEAEIGGVRDEQAEIDEAVEAIGTLETASTVQVPLGGGAYLRAEVQDIDEIVVGLGGGYAAEQDQDGAIDALERKRDALDERIEDLREEIAEVETETEQLEQRAQQMQQQQMQQMMQQQQQQEQGDDE